MSSLQGEMWLPSSAELSIISLFLYLVGPSCLCSFHLRIFLFTSISCTSSTLRLLNFLSFSNNIYPFINNILGVAEECLRPFKTLNVTINLYIIKLASRPFPYCSTILGYAYSSTISRTTWYIKDYR